MIRRHAALLRARRHAAAGRGPGARPDDQPAVHVLPRPRLQVDHLGVSADWLAEHLQELVEQARRGAAQNVLVLHLPADPVVPLGFFEQVAAVQAVSPLAVVTLRSAPGSRTALPDVTSDVGDDHVAVVFGPDVCRSTVATRTADGCFDVRVETRPERVSAQARQLLERGLSA